MKICSISFFHRICKSSSTSNTQLQLVLPSSKLVHPIFTKNKLTVNIVNSPDLVNILLLTKKFTKSGVYCTINLAAILF